MRNPFKPTAGATPPLLVGRDDVLEEFVESLDDGPGAPGRLTLFTGPRGVGKTVMLSEVGDVALRRGWITLAETATPGLVGRLHPAVVRTLHELDPVSAPRRSLTGINLSVVGGGFGMSAPPAEVVEWRNDLRKLLDVLESRSSGLLITVDEVHTSCAKAPRLNGPRDGVGGPFGCRPHVPRGDGAGRGGVVDQCDRRSPRRDAGLRRCLSPAADGGRRHSRHASWLCRFLDPVHAGIPA